MTKRNDREHFNRATTDTESANAPGDSRGVGGAVPCDSGSNLTRKTIRRNMIERLAANERGDIHLDDAEYDAIIKTLGSVREDDENPSNILPILPEKTIPILPMSPNS